MLHILHSFTLPLLTPLLYSSTPPLLHSSLLTPPLLTPPLLTPPLLHFSLLHSSLLHSSLLHSSFLTPHSSLLTPLLHFSTSPPLHTFPLHPSQVHSVASEDEEGPNLLLNCDHLSKDLGSYKDKIRGIVNDWMAHYRQKIGISLPAHLAPTFPHSSSSSLLSRSVSAQGRRIQSSKSYAGME